MALNTKPFTRLVQDWVAAVQGASSTLLDFTPGSILLAIGEATAGVGLWLQALVLKALAAARLATSSGSDVDSFIADFGLTRLAAVSASGAVTFARFTATNPALVPVGALVQTADGTQTFAVYADPTNGAYSATQAGYVVGANVSSVSVPVAAVNGGAAGNIAAGTLTVLQTGISGIDTVTNAAAFTNGTDAESDAAVKARFVAFINSLSEGTTGAIKYAITSIRQGMQCRLLENVEHDGTPDNGMVTAIVDDGSGAISGALVVAAQTAADAVRAAGVRVSVFAASKLTANVVMAITTAAGYDKPTVAQQVQTAIAAYINGLGLDNLTLLYTRLPQVAYDASPGVTGVSGVTLNATTADLVATNLQTIKAGTVTVS